MSFTVNDKQLLNRCRDLVFASVFIILSVSHFTCFALHHFNDFPDSIVKKYPLTDPRNPKCPCYKLQKKAEKEFRKLNAIRNPYSLSIPFSKNKLLGLKKQLDKCTYKRKKFFRIYSKQAKKTTHSRAKFPFLFKIAKAKLSDCPRW